MESTRTGDATRESSAEHLDERQSAEPAGPTPCAERSPADCHTEDGCVIERDGRSCRDAANECELIELEPFAVHPVFDRGDPCQRARPECAWSARTDFCAPFEPVSVCPESVEAASELEVFCDHSEQPALECAFGRTECECRRPSLCGGAPPTDEQANPPSDWGCLPEFDERGCPTRRVRPGTRCNVASEEQCYVGCGLYTCEHGRWREHRLQPRP